MRVRVTRLIAVSAVAALCFGSSAKAGAQTLELASSPTNFDIPSEPLSQALLQLCNEAGVQLIVGAPLARGLRSSAVKGRYRASEALSLLLAGTGLRWRALGTHTVTIEPDQSQTSVAGDHQAVR